MRDFSEQTKAQLCEAIRYSVRYDTKDDKGETRVERNERFGQGDKTPDPPAYPDHCAHVVYWFLELGALRPSGINGQERIGWGDIAAWSVLTGNQLMFDEVEMIVAMDDAYIDQVRIEQDEAQKAAEAKK